MKITTSLLTSTLTALALVVGGSARAQTVTDDTFDATLAPADTDNLRVVSGFAQSFVVTTAGELTSLAFHGDWTPGTLVNTTYAWRLTRDTPLGTSLDGGGFTISAGGAPGSGSWSITLAPGINVAVGDVLVFTLRQTSLSTVGEAELDWWAGDELEDYDSYAPGDSWVRDSIGNFASSEDSFGTPLDLRLAWSVKLPVGGPCATDTTGPQLWPSSGAPPMQLVYEVPSGTTQVTIVATAFDESGIASATIGGQAAAMTQSNEVATATVTVSGGPAMEEVSVIFTDVCGISTIRIVEVRFVDMCAPEFDVCADGASGTVFYVDLIGPAGESCFVRCATDANGQSLACASAPICEP